MLPRHPIRTLIADDSDKFSAVVKDWIEHRLDLNWVGTVSSGLEVAEAVERWSPDMVLLDAVMPGMDGFQVVRQLKKLANPPLVVVISFEGGSAAERAAFEAGADGFIPKDEFAEGLDLMLPALVEKLSDGEVAFRASPVRRRETPGRP